MMKDKMIINIPKSFDFSIQIENEITKFFENYNIEYHTICDETFRELHKTVIELDKVDIEQMINNNDGYIVLQFRIIGATRGGIYIKELERSINMDNNEIIISITYQILYVEFIETTCFTTFNVYSRNIINATEKELTGKNIIINIYK